MKPVTRLLAPLLAPILLLALPGASLRAAPATPSFAPSAAPSAAAREQARHAFDFLLGSWTIDNHRLRNLADPASGWEDFTAHSTVAPLPGGIGNTEEFVPAGWRPGYVGMSLGVFDPVTLRWSLYWLSNRDGGLDPATGSLTPPVVGRFENGIGRFEGDDTLAGRPIKVRFTWTPDGARHARWEQAFSFDAGAHWQTNWTMDFTRPAAGSDAMADLTRPGAGRPD